MSSVVASFHIDSRDINMALQNGTPSNFIMNYKVPILLPSGRNYEVALARGLLFYAWENFSEGEIIANTIFDWNGTVYDIPTGTYSILTLEAKIKEILANNGHNPSNFSMRKDYPTGLIEICTSGGDSFTPLRADFCKMIGATVGQTWVNTCAYCDSKPDFEGLNTSIFINIDNLEGARSFINENNNPYVYPVKAPVVPAYSQFDVVDTLGELIYYPLSTNQIMEWRIKIVNQNNEVVDLHGTNVKYWFIIRERIPSNEVVISNFKEMRIPNY